MGIGVTGFLRWGLVGFEFFQVHVLDQVGLLILLVTVFGRMWMLVVHLVGLP